MSEKKSRKDFDLRYARERMAFQNARARGEIADAPPPYNYQAFRRGNSHAAQSLRNGYTDFRKVAQYTGLSVNTVRDALGGRAVKFEPLFILAEHYGVDPLRLFDVDDRLKWNDKGELVGVNKPRTSTTAPPLPKTGSRNAK